MRVLPFSAISTIAALAAALAATPSEAAPVSGTYNFTATNFTVGSKYTTVTGAITLSFDSATASTGAVLTFSSPEVTSASPVDFAYVPGLDNLTIGGTNATVFTSDPTTNDFALQISSATSGARKFTTFSYSLGGGVAFSATGTANSVTFTPAAVPEPASAALIGAGLVGAALTRRKRRGSSV